MADTVKGIEIRCPNCGNLYGVMAATVGVIEIKCTRPHCKKVSEGVFSVVVVAEPSLIDGFSALVESFVKSGRYKAQQHENMVALTTVGKNTIIRR